MDFSSLQELMTVAFLGKPAWLWALFLGFVTTLLIIDLGLFNRKDHVIGISESLKMSAGYIAVGLLFGLWVWYNNGAESAADYYTVYLLEKSLSLDNLFVMSVIFSSFYIPREYQHRVLVYGIIGVIILRGIMIGAGAALVHSYEWVLFLFAAILIYTGIKMMLMKDDDGGEDYTQKNYVRFMARHLRISDKVDGRKFFTRVPSADSNNLKPVLHATPLFLALLTIELTDVMFAFDSIPAALAITTDTYIVYTANICAILGLRALFFAMEHVIHRFAYLKYSLSIILIFIGGKVFYNHFFEKIPGIVSLSLTLAILLGGVIFSILKTQADKEKQEEKDAL